MVRTLLLGLLVSISSTAFAQESIRVFGTDYATSSRLVLPVSPDRVWELRTTGRRAVLSFVDADFELDTSDVFSRLSKRRILSVKSENISGDVFLSLSLGCDCDVIAAIDGSRLVLDVFDEKSEENAPESLTDSVSERPQQTAGSAPSITSSPRPSSRPSTQPQAPAASGNSGQDEADASNLGSRLIAQLEKAAEQGIIELAEQDSSPVPETPQAEVPSQSSELQPDTALQPDLQPIDGLEGLGARVASDLEGLLTLPEFGDSVRINIPEEESGQENYPSTGKKPNPEETAKVAPDLSHCIDDRQMDTANWAEETSFSEQYATLQSRVFGEFDVPDQTAVLEMAQLFIYFGLGTETRSLLADTPSDDVQIELLREMALVVEGKKYIKGGLLDKGAGCEGLIALWRTAAIDTEESQPILSPDAIIDDFSRLPIHIRRVIGPRLSQSFITRGQKQEANRVFSIVDRAAGYHGDGHEMTRAKLAILDGNNSFADQILWTLVTENSEQAVPALVLLVDSYLTQGKTVPDRVIETAETMAFQHRGGSEEIALRLAEIRAKSGSDRFEDALDTALKQMDRNQANADTYMALIDIVLKDATVDTVGTGAYAKAIFSHMDTVTDDRVTDTAKVTVAREILKAGLPNTSLTILEGPVRAESARAKDVAVKAYLNLEKPEEALRLLAGNNSESAALSTALALQQLGRYDDANAAAKGSGQTDAQRDFGWRAGDWAASAPSESPVKSTLSQYMTLVENSATTREGPSNSLDDPAIAVASRLSEEVEISLKRSRQLAKQASAIRGFLKDALASM